MLCYPETVAGASWSEAIVVGATALQFTVLSLRSSQQRTQRLLKTQLGVTVTSPGKSRFRLQGSCNPRARTNTANRQRFNRLLLILQRTDESNDYDPVKQCTIGSCGQRDPERRMSASTVNQVT